MDALLHLHNCVPKASMGAIHEFWRSINAISIMCRRNLLTPTSDSDFLQHEHSVVCPGDGRQLDDAGAEANHRGGGRAGARRRHRGDSCCQRVEETKMLG